MIANQNEPHLFISGKMLFYYGEPEVYGIGIKDKIKKVHASTNSLCQIKNICRIVITKTHIIIYGLALFFKIPHTPQTYQELKTIMETHGTTRNPL